MIHTIGATISGWVATASIVGCHAATCTAHAHSVHMSELDSCCAHELQACMPLLPGLTSPESASSTAGLRVVSASPCDASIGAITARAAKAIERIRAGTRTAGELSATHSTAATITATRAAATAVPAAVWTQQTRARSTYKARIHAHIAPRAHGRTSAPAAGGNQHSHRQHMDSCSKRCGCIRLARGECMREERPAQKQYSAPHRRKKGNNNAAPLIAAAFKRESHALRLEGEVLMNSSAAVNICPCAARAAAGPPLRRRSRHPELHPSATSDLGRESAPAV